MGWTAAGPPARYGRHVVPRLMNSVIEEFSAWAAAQGRDVGGKWRDRITILLQCRADYLNRPDPTHWRSGGVHDLLMTYLPARQVDAWNLAEHAPEMIRDYLRFLDETDRAHPACARVPTLLKELDRLIPKFPAAMADRSRWHLAKSVFTAAFADGLTVGSAPAELDAWAERFSALEPDDRRQFIGHLMKDQPAYGSGRLLIHDGKVALLARGAPARKHLVWPDIACDCGCSSQARFPAVTLPPIGELAKQADDSGPLDQLTALADWAAAADRHSDNRGRPRKADLPDLYADLGLPADAYGLRDAPVLDRTWQLAIDFDILQLRRTRIVLGRGADPLRGDAEDEEFLSLWAELADALIKPAAMPDAPRDRDLLDDWLQPWAPRLLGLLYAATAPDGAPTDLDVLVAQLLDEYASRLPASDPDMFAHLATTNLHHVLGALADHGAVAADTDDAPEPDPVALAGSVVFGIPPWAVQPTKGLRIGLTSLGRYLIRQRLLAEGAHAPATTGVSG